MQVFSLKTGFYNVDAQEAGEYLTKINEEYGEIKPEVLVEKARNESNVLHNCFEWDDTKAAESYRLNQASSLIGNITVRFTTEDNTEKETRAFVRVSFTKEEDKTYQPIQKALQNEYSRELLMRQAKNEMKYFVAKYEILKEYNKVLIPMKEIINEK